MSVPGEKTVEVFRRSPFTPGFWWRTIVSLGTYLLTLWRMNAITLTTRRVTQRTGHVLGGTEVSINVENISDVKVEKGVLGSIFNFGKITIYSTGGSGSTIEFAGLGNPDFLRNLIADLQDGRLDSIKLKK